MRILSVDTAGKALSLALVENGRLLASAGLNVGLTHSQRLLPLLQALLEGAGLKFGELSAIAVVNGPGSFTGLRIGIATTKGLAWALGLPLLAVSTLEAAAYNAFAPGMAEGVLACPVLDARRNEVYTALYAQAAAGDTDSPPELALREIRPAQAISPAELAGRLEDDLRPGGRQVVLTGDAAELIYDELRDKLGARVLLAAPERRFYNACGCAYLAEARFKAGLGQKPAEVGAFYLRLSEAERNRLAREGAL